MIYPNNFEQKIGFNQIQILLKQYCLSSLGKDKTDELSFSTSFDEVNEWLQQIHEFRQLLSISDDFPLQFFYDVRPQLARLRLEGTHMEEAEMFDLRRSLDTICRIVNLLTSPSGGSVSSVTPTNEHPYPALQRLADGVPTFPTIIHQIDQILDKFGNIKDTASRELAQIRRELANTEGGVSRTLYGILKNAQSEGLVEKDVTPAVRDGRIVIPVAPGLKRRIRGIVHDESASGKTVFIEPAEVVEANNRIRELKARERREIIRILSEFAKLIRPYVPQLLQSYFFLASIDLLQAKAKLAELMKAIEPKVLDTPCLDWIQAIHPLLQLALDKHNKKVVPLDIMLTSEKRILIISGPNAGGKSVCLKTTGLLQYMLQCGLSVPMGERSHCGLFKHILIDIGDEQSIENDLSTYSSHLLNMKNMIKTADEETLLLIDEFGTGTEPQIGSAIAESVLGQFCRSKAWGVITTHYQNLKIYADSHEGIANGAMLYDRHEMKPLFQLQIGQPGSSFAIEIARKIGLPEEVITEASDIVGKDYIQSDKFLQDIVRDKRYWENKRQTIHAQEKRMQQMVDRYESEISVLQNQRKEILDKAKEQADELLRESNKRIEAVIREIKESQAAKEETKRIREELNQFKQAVSDLDSSANDELIARKIKQIQERKERREKRKQEKAAKAQKQAVPGTSDTSKFSLSFQSGDYVRIKGLASVGRIEKNEGTMATIIFGDMRTKMRTDRLEAAEAPKQEASPVSAYTAASHQTRETIDNRRAKFKPDIDVRGMRGDEAINAVTYFIDDALLVGMNRVRILHGTGTGVLRTLIREYLAVTPGVESYHDEHVQFGGAGITVVNLV